MMTWGNYNVPLTIMDFIVNFIFLFSYLMSPALFVHFTLNFPKSKNVHRVTISFIYISALMVTLPGNSLNFRVVPCYVLPADI